MSEGYRASAIACAGLVALAVAMGIGRFAFTPILPMMQEDAGVSIVTGGWLASANYVGYLLGALSIIALRIRPATAIRVGLVTIGLATLGMGLETHLAGWVVLRAVAGVASAWVMINVSAWCLDRLAPLQRPLLGGTVFAGVGAGIALSGAVCLVLMHVHVSAAGAWIVLGVLALGLSAGIFGVFDDENSTPSRGGAIHSHRGSWNGDWTRLVLCYGAFGFGYIIPATFLPVLAKQTIDDPAVFGWSWPIFGVAAATSAIVTALVRGASNRRLWVAAHLTMACGVALPIVRPGIGVILLAALGVGGTFMVITMVGMREARSVAGPQAARLMAAMTAAFGLGQIAGPIMVSHVAGGGNFSFVLAIASLVLVISACVLAGSGRPAPA